jgi:hypothetical protein
LLPWKPLPNRLYALRIDFVILKLAVRQLTVKADSSNSWFICIDNILRKYDMKEANTYLESPISKSKWSSVVKSKVREIRPDLDILLVMRATVLSFVFETFLIVLMVSTTVVIIPCHIVRSVKHSFYIC